MCLPEMNARSELALMMELRNSIDRFRGAEINFGEFALELQLCCTANNTSPSCEVNGESEWESRVAQMAGSSGMFVWRDEPVFVRTLSLIFPPTVLSGDFTGAFACRVLL